MKEFFNLSKKRLIIVQEIIRKGSKSFTPSSLSEENNSLSKSAILVLCKEMVHFGYLNERNNKFFNCRLNKLKSYYFYCTGNLAKGAYWFG